MARKILTTKLIRTEGLDELRKNCNRVITRTSAVKMKGSNMKHGHILKNEARSNVREMTKHPTGELESRIFVGPGDPRKSDVLVGVDSKGSPTNLGHLVEFGTSRSAPVPFMRQAVVSTRPLIARGLAEDAMEAIEDALPK